MSSNTWTYSTGLTSRGVWFIRGGPHRDGGTWRRFCCVTAAAVLGGSAPQSESPMAPQYGHGCSDPERAACAVAEINVPFGPAIAVDGTLADEEWAQSIVLSMISGT